MDHVSLALVAGALLLYSLVSGRLHGTVVTAPLVFIVFGAVLLPDALANVEPLHFLYALLSLTVLRMIPVAISLLGSGLRAPTRLFLGWFGPRGLASILFVLLILEHTQIVHRGELFSITVVTVMLSALLHGVSAAPLSRIYGRLAESMGECEETQPVSQVALRAGLPPDDSTSDRETAR